MENEQSASFFKIVLLDEEEKDLAEYVQPKHLVNLKFGSKVRKISVFIIFFTAQVL